MACPKQLRPDDVLSPCPARWSGMPGDAQQRFCGQCQKHVHDLDAQDDAALDAFARAHAGEAVCVRLSRPRTLGVWGAALAAVATLLPASAPEAVVPPRPSPLPDGGARPPHPTKRPHPKHRPEKTMGLMMMPKDDH
jgi:hypothetical protein